MSGYMVTMEREDAPRRILWRNDDEDDRRRTERVDVPVGVELQQHAQPDGQLSREEPERLTTRDITARERPRARPL